MDERWRNNEEEEEEGGEGGEGGGGMKMRKEGGAYLPVFFVKQRSLESVSGREGAGFVVCVSATTAHTAGRRAQRDHQ